MLSPQTIAIVKSTAPVLEEHGETLTRHFYRRMFRENPEVAPFFNPAHQEAGTQQRALAAAICAYAANIDNLSALGGAVEVIAQKHASLQVNPEHYPIVGANLLAAIREVLGEAATEEIIGAWGEAYHFLADILIAREKEIYREQESAPRGWSGFKPFRLLRRKRESDIITSFYLQPADGGTVPDFKPGQYITVRVPTPCGHTTMRNYSLSDKPGQPWFRISVKRERASKSDTPDGFVSAFLHESLQEGGVLEVGPPCGEFFLKTPEHPELPLVLIAAGVGVTPLMSMLLTSLERYPERPVVFIQAALNARVHAFREEVLELATRHPRLTVHFRYSDPPAEDGSPDGRHSSGFVDSALIRSLVPGMNADFYLCGPKPFMGSVYHQLLTEGLDAGRIHFEFFGPRQELERPAPAGACPAASVVAF